MYTDGTYLKMNPRWHSEDAAGKVEDLWPYVRRLVADLGVRRLADVGCGVGQVTLGLQRSVTKAGLVCEFHGYEPSTDAFALIADPDQTVRFRNDYFLPTGEHFDAVCLVDVLEHLADPREALRAAALRSRYVLVRQPLLESLGAFRHVNYGHQRETLGHINYWNVRSFGDLMVSCGWCPVDVKLLAPWELSRVDYPSRLLSRLLLCLSREWASFLSSGFYMIGIFQNQNYDSSGRR